MRQEIVAIIVEALGDRSLCAHGSVAAVAYPRSDWRSKDDEAMTTLRGR
jgi:hypothetical protein